MKNIFCLIALFLLLCSTMLAQVSISIDNSTPNPAAMLDVKSSNKGFLPPRMTHTELNTISSLPNGLIVFCTDCAENGSGALVVFISGSWQRLSTGCLNPVPPVPGTQVPSPTQIVWNWYPAAEATGYKWNTTNNFSTAIDVGTETTKTETGLDCLATYTRYIWTYNSCGNSLPTTLTQTTLNCDFNCGSSIIINHVTDTVAPVTKTVTYGTVTNIPGEPSKCWITSNLGADHQATAVNDATEASAGWYWQFNRKQGFKHDGTTRTPNTTWINSIIENSEWIATNDPCNIEFGNGWRIPTYSEWNNVDASGNWTDWNGPWTSGLKMHVAGSLYYGDGSLNDCGYYGNYWSSTQQSSGNGWYLSFNISYSNFYGLMKSYGFSVRCIREN